MSTASSRDPPSSQDLPSSSLLSSQEDILSVDGTPTLFQNEQEPPFGEGVLKQQQDNSLLKYEDYLEEPTAMLIVPASTGPTGTLQDHDVEHQQAAGTYSGSSPRSMPTNDTKPAASGSGGEAEILKDKSNENQRRKYWIAAAIGVVVLIALVFGLALGLSGNDDSEERAIDASTSTNVEASGNKSPSPITSSPITASPTVSPVTTSPTETGQTRSPTAAPSAPFFQQVGNNIDGTRMNNYLGSALAMSQTGHRIAVASPGAVRVYELMTDKWRQIGQEIVISNSTEGKLLKLLDGFATMDMNSNGDRIVTAFGDSDNENGIVQVYRYALSRWVRVGSPLTSPASRDQFGAAVSMNAAGDVIAVGAPGNEGSRGKIIVYELGTGGEWARRGQIIRGEVTSTVSELGGSVALSADGLRVAAAAKTNPDDSGVADSPVVKVFEYDRFQNSEWTALGDGVNAGITRASTGWYVSLSAAGDRIVVSNSYLYEADFVNVETDSLRVQAFEFVNESWEPLGQNMHANVTGPKSGYVVTLSDDGTKIGMGDPGTSSGGRSRGHAHIYQYKDNEWMQIGPNINGQADGDSFGFAIALSGDATMFAIGAPFSRAANTDAGRVLVLQL